MKPSRNNLWASRASFRRAALDNVTSRARYHPATNATPSRPGGGPFFPSVSAIPPAADGLGGPQPTDFSLVVEAPAITESSNLVLHDECGTLHATWGDSPAGACRVGSTISSLIGAAETGDSAAADMLFSTLYSELHRLANRELARRGSPASLSATTLLHEAHLDIAAREGNLTGRDSWAMPRA